MEREIVAVRIGSWITTDLSQIKQAARSNSITDYVSKDMAEMMASLDLGVNWERLAKSPVLFTINTETHEIKDGLFKRRVSSPQPSPNAAANE